MPLPAAAATGNSAGRAVAGVCVCVREGKPALLLPRPRERREAPQRSRCVLPQPPGGAAEGSPALRAGSEGRVRSWLPGAEPCPRPGRRGRTAEGGGSAPGARAARPVRPVARLRQAVRCAEAAAGARGGGRPRENGGTGSPAAGSVPACLKFHCFQRACAPCQLEPPKGAHQWVLLKPNRSRGRVGIFGWVSGTGRPSRACLGGERMRHSPSLLEPGLFVQFLIKFLIKFLLSWPYCGQS